MAVDAVGSREAEGPRGDAARGAVLGRFFLLSYGLVLLNAFRFLLDADVQSAAALAWVLAVYLTYGLLYLLPAAAPAAALHFLLRIGPAARGLRLVRVPPSAVVYGTAVLLGGAVQLLVFADLVLHRMYGFHVNGFVWNLVLTPGGIESLGADPAAERTFALLAAAAVAAEAALLWAALRWRTLGALWERHATKGGAAALAGAFVALGGAERLAYGGSDVWDYRPVLSTAGAFPFYVPVRLRGFAKRMGIRAAGGRDLPSLKVDALHLRYPKAPLVPGPGARDLNVVWLTAESWRFDMLDPEITPETWAFAARSVRFTDHYSSGNGTRMGIFGMFYGLYGPYWFPFLEERRDPAMMDYLLDRGYDVEAFTSARFTFPEFDRTVFARFPADRLHEGAPALLGWQNDRRKVEDLLASLDRRPAGKPFFRFMFFESPHARYHFPDECAIRRPFLDTVNYATMDLGRDMPLIRNRYVNSCRHLDTQFARVIRGLEERGLLDSTVVLLTGDHGEEFMERGRWGHHSAFNRFQTRTPLVLHAPGVAPAVVTRMTSHLDLPATVLGLLGVANPSSDYSLGDDLLGPETRTESVLSGWDDLAFRGKSTTVAMPVRRAGIAGKVVLDADDRALDDAKADVVLAASRDRIQAVLRGLSRFRK